MEYSTVEELLSDPNRWCKHSYAKKADGSKCMVYDPEACQWCLKGAVMKVYGGEYQKKLTWTEATSKLLDCLPGNISLEGYNDTVYRSHEEVMALVRKAGV